MSFEFWNIGLGPHMWKNHKITEQNLMCQYNAHTEPIFEELSLLKVEGIIKLQVMKFDFKFKNGPLPHYLQSLPLQHNQDVHSHNTQSSTKKFTS